MDYSDMDDNDGLSGGITTMSKDSDCISCESPESNQEIRSTPSSSSIRVANVAPAQETKSVPTFPDQLHRFVVHQGHVYKQVFGFLESFKYPVGTVPEEFNMINEPNRFPALEMTPRQNKGETRRPRARSPYPREDESDGSAESIPKDLPPEPPVPSVAPPRPPKSSWLETLQSLAVRQFQPTNNSSPPTRNEIHSNYCPRRVAPPVSTRPATLAPQVPPVTPPINSARAVGPLAPSSSAASSGPAPPSAPAASSGPAPTSRPAASSAPATPSAQTSSPGPNDCPICREPITNRAVPNNCNHAFCFECLTHYITTSQGLNISGIRGPASTGCPYCRIPFTEIYHHIQSDLEYQTMSVAQARVQGGLRGLFSIRSPSETSTGSYAVQFPANSPVVHVGIPDVESTRSAESDETIHPNVLSSAEVLGERIEQRRQMMMDARRRRRIARVARLHRLREERRANGRASTIREPRGHGRGRGRGHNRGRGRRRRNNNGHQRRRSGSPRHGRGHEADDESTSRTRGRSRSSRGRWRRRRRGHQSRTRSGRRRSPD